MSNNANQKNFQSNSKGLTAPPTLHETIPALTQRLFNDIEGYPRRFWANAAGIIVAKDAVGTSATYNVLASQAWVMENVTEIEATTDIELIAQW